jgi:hypothetical protein
MVTQSRPASIDRYYPYYPYASINSQSFAPKYPFSLYLISYYPLLLRAFLQ